MMVMVMIEKNQTISLSLIITCQRFSFLSTFHSVSPPIFWIKKIQSDFDWNTYQFYTTSTERLNENEKGQFFFFCESEKIFKPSASVEV